MDLRILGWLCANVWWMLELAENVGLFLFVAIQKLYVFTAAVYGELAARMGGAWGTCFCLMVTNCSSWKWICLLVGIGVVLRRRNNKSEFVQKTSTAKGYQRIWTKHWEAFYSCAESIYFMNLMILGLASVLFLNQQEIFWHPITSYWDILHQSLFLLNT